MQAFRKRLWIAPVVVALMTRADGPIHVKPGGSGSGSCDSWANACELQYALQDVATSGDEIWVAEGTHKPTDKTDRTVTFQLKNGMTLYGGFAGT